MTTVPTVADQIDEGAAVAVDSVVTVPSPITAPVSLVAGHIAIVTLGNVATPVIGLLTTPILAFGLGVDGRGELAAATAPLMFGLAVGTMGMPEALIYWIARSRLVQRQFLSLGLLVGLASAFVLTGASVLLAPDLSGHDPTIRSLTILAALFLLPTLEIAVIRGVAAGLQRWSLVAAEQAITAVVRLALVGGLAAVGRLTPLTATLATVLPLLLGAVVYISLLRGIPIVTAMQADRTRPQFLSYGTRIWLGNLGGIVLLRLDQLILTPLSSARQLGIYVVAVSVAESVLVITNSVRDVTFSADAAESSSDRLQMSARIATAAAATCALALALVAPFAIPLLFGRQFAPATRVIWMLLIAIVLLTPGSVAGAGLTARGHPGIRSAALVAAATVNVVALIVLLPPLGALGAAVATLAGNVIFGGLNMVILARMANLRVSGFFWPRAADARILNGLIRDGVARVRRRSA